MWVYVEIYWVTNLKAKERATRRHDYIQEFKLEHFCYLFTLLPSVCWPNGFHQIWFHMGPSVDIFSFSPIFYASVIAEERTLGCPETVNMLWVRTTARIKQNGSEWNHFLIKGCDFFLIRRKEGICKQQESYKVVCFFLNFLYLIIPFPKNDLLSFFGHLLVYAAHISPCPCYLSFCDGSFDPYVYWNSSSYLY